MNGIIRQLDAQLSYFFCLAKGFVRLIDQIEVEDGAHVMTVERRARAGWTDYQ